MAQKRRGNPGVRDLGRYASYSALAAFLGKKDARSIAHNTMVVRIDEENIGVILHSTRIIAFNVEGAITLNSGGYFTTTTKQRINQFLRPNGWSLYQKKREWFVEGLRGEKHRFYDNMVLAGKGHPAGPFRENPRGQRGTSWDEYHDVRRQLPQFVWTGAWGYRDNDPTSRIAFSGDEFPKKGDAEERWDEILDEWVKDEQNSYDDEQEVDVEEELALYGLFREDIDDVLKDMSESERREFMTDLIRDGEAYIPGA